MSKYSKPSSSSPGGAFTTIRNAVHDLYPKLDKSGGCLQTILKSLDKGAASNTAGESGEKALPFDFNAAAKFKVHNVHHSACIEAKTQAAVGLGHVEKSTGSVLNKLCQVSWQTTMSQLAEDYFQVGNAYLEVVRDGIGGKITGLHHIAACDVRILIEDDNGINRHFVIKGRGVGLDGRHEVKMAVFNDGQDFVRPGRPGELLENFSEIVHFPKPSSMSKWYGFPEWLAATAPVELVQALHQHQFDFHVNRGVPEFILFLLGAKADKKTWNDLTQAFGSYVGVGNSQKSSIFNLPDPNMEIQLEKLALDGVQNGTFFRDMSETLAMAIVSAHRTPPSLAGILIPGKMGAANESSNAIITFQALTVGPAQHHFETILGCTLGSEAGVDGLGEDSFELKTIVDEVAEAMKKLQPLDTMNRMKDELGDAATEGRDVADGLQKSDDDDGTHTDILALACNLLEASSKNKRAHPEIEALLRT